MPTEAEVAAARATLDEAAKADAVKEDENRAEYEANLQKWLSECFQQRVTKFVSRDAKSVGYNAGSMLDFGRSVESTCFYSLTFENGAVFHYGIGAIRNGNEASILMTHPGGRLARPLCMHRVKRGYESNKACEENREFWIASAKLFKRTLKDFETLIANVAKELCRITGFSYNADTWRAPIKKRVVSYKWE